jgi:hypothetical protein
VKHHVRSVDSVGGSVRHEQAAVRVKNKITRRPAEGARHQLNALLASFDFDERTHGRFVERDGDVLGCIFFPVLS